MDVGCGHSLSTKSFTIIDTPNLNSRKYASKKDLTLMNRNSHMTILKNRLKKYFKK
tara:strand:- start:150 stop:317 length:168 start_codon:yes stop_codon:yes gene_type:complete